MKQFILLILINLLFVLQPAHAGFVIKHSIGAETAIAKQQHSTVLNVIPAKSYSCFNRVSWVGYAALISAIVGLFVPAFSIITILFGILGMTRGCRADRLATLAMIAGIGELVLFLLTNSAVLIL